MLLNTNLQKTHRLKFSLNSWYMDACIIPLQSCCV